MATQQQQRSFNPFDADAESIHHPPWFIFTLSWIGIITGGLANLWQIITSIIAFFTLFLAGSGGYTPQKTTGALLVSTGMAVSFQLGLTYFVFRISQEMKTQKTSGIDGTIKTTAVAMINHHKLLLIWTIISFVACTVSDYTFVNILTSDPILLFLYAASLYAASTILLSKALEKNWAAKVAYANWRAYLAYTTRMEQKNSGQGNASRKAANDVA